MRTGLFGRLRGEHRPLAAGARVRRVAATWPEPAATLWFELVAESAGSGLPG